MPLKNFQIGTGADRWSAVTTYKVTFNETSVKTPETRFTIPGLDKNTNYARSVIASNAQGESPRLIKVAATDPTRQGMYT